MAAIPGHSQVSGAVAHRAKAPRRGGQHTARLDLVHRPLADRRRTPNAAPVRELAPAAQRPGHVCADIARGLEQVRVRNKVLGLGFLGSAASSRRRRSGAGSSARTSRAAWSGCVQRL